MRRFASRLLAAGSLLLAITSAQAAQRPHYGGVLRVSLSPRSAPGSLRWLVIENLTRVDEHGMPQPQLATTWEAQNGGRRWQFWLRTKVRFHDGTSLTPAAVINSFATCENCPWTALRPVGGSVVFEFSTPRPHFDAEMALPQFGISRQPANQAASEAGTGPFRYGAARAGATPLLANDDYWGGRPFLDGIDITQERAARARATEPEMANADVVEGTAQILRRTLPPRSALLSSQPTELIALTIFNHKPVLQDVRLRQAISLAVDRAAIADVLLQKQAEAAGGLLPNWVSGYAFLLPRARDLQRAQQLVRELGNIPPVSITTSEPGDASLQLIAERLALNLRDCGIVAQTSVRADGADLQVQRLELQSANPFAAFLSIASRVISTDETVQNPPDFQELYASERALVAQFRTVPLAWVPRAFAVSLRVHDAEVTPDGRLRLENAWLDPAGAGK